MNGILPSVVHRRNRVLLPAIVVGGGGDAACFGGEWTVGWCRWKKLSAMPLLSSVLGSKPLVLSIKSGHDDGSVRIGNGGRSKARETISSATKEMEPSMHAAAVNDGLQPHPI
ncbi:hypothetical protein ACLOJK_006879 [Asimina triloba]